MSKPNWRPVPSWIDWTSQSGPVFKTLIFLILDNALVSLVQVVPKKGGRTIVENEKNELISMRMVTGWRVCIDYRRLNDSTRKNHSSLPFIDQMLEWLSRHIYYYFLDELSGYFQIPITREDQEKTTFTCLYGTFVYRRMSFGLWNTPRLSNVAW